MFKTNRRNFILRLASFIFAAPTTSLLASNIYLVRKGDTLSRIAVRHGTSIKELKSINRLSSDMIKVGQKLKLPGKSEVLTQVREKTKRIRVNHKKWKYIVAHHSGTPHGNAASYERAHRTRGMKNGLGYHFIIGNGRDSKDGEIEIGSRWTKQLHGGHVSKWEYNNHGIGICLVGNFEKTKPTTKQLAALKELISYLGNDLLNGKYKFHVHKEINATLCPGKNFPTKEMHRIFG